MGVQAQNCPSPLLSFRLAVLELLCVGSCYSCLCFADTRRHQLILHKIASSVFSFFRQTDFSLKASHRLLSAIFLPVISEVAILVLQIILL